METLNLTLEWKGPFGHVPDGPNPWFYEQAELKESPPGIYLQTLFIEDQYFVYYVGETNDLLRRTREHIVGFLGGQYWHYDPMATIKNKKERSNPYNPASAQYQQFLTRSSVLRAMAYEWLAALQLFVWIDAKRELDGQGRRLVESAIITTVMNPQSEPNSKWLCDNSERVPDSPVELGMIFRDGYSVAGLPNRLLHPG
ncbi:MAG: hypothetical protein IID33_08495 [Planctomycetes bacterium]|nr:hypothetical protein [Planctomycetota bacterium]